MAIEQLSPPGNVADLLAPPNVPVLTGGDVLIEPGDDLKTITYGGREWFITPVDPLTGLPYPILQNGHMRRDDPQNVNVHHGMHPANSSELDLSTLSGAALRNCRLQLVRAVDHNIRMGSRPPYHYWMYGSILPQGETNSFMTCTAAVMGTTSPYALDFSTGEPRVVQMTQAQMELLHTPTIIRPIDYKRAAKLVYKAEQAYNDLPAPSTSQDEYVAQTVADYKQQQVRGAGFALRYLTYRHEPVRDFFTDYVLRQEPTDIREVDIEEFLITTDMDRKHFLGQLLIAKAVEIAADNVYDMYTQVRKEGRSNPRVPYGPRILIRNMLGRTPKQRVAVADQLGQRLRSLYDIAA